MTHQPAAEAAAMARQPGDQCIDRFQQLRDSSLPLLLWTTANEHCTESILAQGEPGSQGVILGYSRVAANRVQIRKCAWRWQLRAAVTGVATWTQQLTGEHFWLINPLPRLVRALICRPPVSFTTRGVHWLHPPVLFRPPPHLLRFLFTCSQSHHPTVLDRWRAVLAPHNCTIWMGEAMTAPPDWLIEGLQHPA